MNNLLKTSFIENGKKMTESEGVLVNISETIEGKTLAALNGDKVIEGLPSVIPIGLLPPYGFEKRQPLALAVGLLCPGSNSESWVMG